MRWEKAKTEKEAHGEFESEHPGYCGAQDTFYVGNLKGVGRVYQQTFIDTYTKVAFAKLYDRKTPTTVADLLNDRVVPFFDSQDVKLLRVRSTPPLPIGKPWRGLHQSLDQSPEESVSIKLSPIRNGRFFWRDELPR